MYASEKHHVARLLDYSVEIVSDTNAKQKAVVHAIIHNGRNFTYNERIRLKIHSFLKQCCARSSFYENKTLHLMSAEEGFVKYTMFS